MGQVIMSKGASSCMEAPPRQLALAARSQLRSAPSFHPAVHLPPRPPPPGARRVFCLPLPACAPASFSGPGPPALPPLCSSTLLLILLLRSPPRPTHGQGPWEEGLYLSAGEVVGLLDGVIRNEDGVLTSEPEVHVVVIWVLGIHAGERV